MMSYEKQLAKIVCIKLEKIQDGSKYPKCPDCKKPLFHIGLSYSKEREAKLDEYRNCDHEWDEESISDDGIRFNKCKKCGFDHTDHEPYAHDKRSFRCMECGSLCCTAQRIA